MTYLSINQWAVKKNYANFGVYDKEFPSQATLESMLDDISALMDDEMGNFTGTEVSDSQYTKTLNNIAYRGVELMIDEEEGRSRGENTMMYVPKDYLYARDRLRLQRIGALKDFLEVGGIG